MLGLPYTLHEIAQEIFPLDLFQGNPDDILLRYVAFDSRLIIRGRETVFIAIKTTNRDGHEFLQQAMDKGVRNFIVDRVLPFSGINYIIVQDTLEALQMWAMYHRSRFNCPVVALTGSNGKTTVKEWLATLLEMNYLLVKSPMSYNSQLGVPVSVLQMRPDADLAIFEAGISKKDEMETLATIIQPSIGILTHMGDAHSEGFASHEEKLREKLRLFAQAQLLLSLSHQPLPTSALPSHTEYISIGYDEQADIKATYVHDEQGSVLHIQDHCFKLPLQGEAARENALLAILAANKLGMSLEEIARRVPLLYPVSMRMEMITDNPFVHIINDSYNIDVDSVENAFMFLQQSLGQDRKQLILTDIPNLGNKQLEIQQGIWKQAKEMFGEENIWTIGEVFGRFRQQQHYLTTQSLLAEFDYHRFVHSTVLLKGARKFELERLVPLLSQKLSATYFKVNLNTLIQNLRHLKTYIPEGTKIMCMVKAFSYGSGTWEIAQVLEKEGVEYLAVAYTSEGIQLRNAGIQLPIMVMNPDRNGLEGLLQFDLEPEIYDFDFLQAFVRVARLTDMLEYRIHLKFATGMGRLGFRADELPAIIEFLSHYPDLQVVSVLSHLAAADDSQEDTFTLNQIAQFQEIAQRLTAELGITPLSHILNSAGVMRFSPYAMDMVRLGVALYGINPLAKDLVQPKHASLQEIGSLHSVISQIHEYPKGTSIGYGRSQFTQRKTRIATIPIGYADGIARSLGNGKINFLIKGKYAPTFGRICMDMLMLDVTDIPEAEEGNEVVLFGRQDNSFISVNSLAEAMETIAYEVLVRIPPRVRRIYEKE